MRRARRSVRSSSSPGTSRAPSRGSALRANCSIASGSGTGPTAPDRSRSLISSRVLRPPTRVATRSDRLLTIRKTTSEFETLECMAAPLALLEVEVDDLSDPECADPLAHEASDDQFGAREQDAG